MKIVVLERNSVGTDISIERITSLGEAVVYPNTVADEVVERIHDAEIIVANKVPLNEGTLKDAPNVKLICEFATGFDNVDIAYCRSRGIKVANIVGYSTDSVAQHTFALCLYVLEKLKRYDDYVKSGTYAAKSRFSNFDLPFFELAGKTWGIVGMGNIGRKVAQIAAAFGCRVIFYSVTGKSSCTDYERVDFDTLLTESDVLSLHCPLTPQTKHMINKETLALMKPTAFLINTSRGALIDEPALIEALEKHQIAGAGLDVQETEPPKADNPLYTLDNVILTPHMGWKGLETRQRLVSILAGNVKGFLEGTPVNVVS